MTAPRRVLLGLVMLMAAAAAAAAQSLRVAQPNAAHFPEVTLYAYPTDGRGVLLPNLGPASFHVTENGLPARVLRVESRGGTLDICLALDRSRSMRADRKMDYAKLAAGELVRQLAPGDRAALITFGKESSLDQALTAERERVLAAVDRADPNDDGTAFLDGVYWAINQVALRQQSASSIVGAGPGRSEARRVVLALTDGNDNSSHVFAQRLVDFARANGVSLCMVALGDDAATTDMFYLSQQTGGVYLRAPLPQDLQRLYVSLAEQLRGEYRVTLRTPRPEADGTRREVRVAIGGHPLSGDTWYQAPGQGSLLVTVGPGSVPGGSAAAAVAGAGVPDRAVLTGVLLMVAGLAATLVALLFWMGNRHRRLPIADSNPKIDLLPLWVRHGSTLVGRGAECGVVLDSHGVSRVHARIEGAQGVFHVYDEGSRNGTFVNGKRVRHSRPLRVGDQVRFGDREFRFGGELPR